MGSQLWLPRCWSSKYVTLIARSTWQMFTGKAGSWAAPPHQIPAAPPSQPGRLSSACTAVAWDDDLRILFKRASAPMTRAKVMLHLNLIILTWPYQWKIAKSVVIFNSSVQNWYLLALQVLLIHYVVSWSERVEMEVVEYKPTLLSDITQWVASSSWGAEAGKEADLHLLIVSLIWEEEIGKMKKNTFKTNCVINLFQDVVKAGCSLIIRLPSLPGLPTHYKSV